MTNNHVKKIKNLYDFRCWLIHYNNVNNTKYNFTNCPLKIVKLYKKENEKRP